jgi:hypothetical protein
MMLDAEQQYDLMKKNFIKSQDALREVMANQPSKFQVLLGATVDSFTSSFANSMNMVTGSIFFFVHVRVGITFFLITKTRTQK